MSEKEFALSSRNILLARILTQRRGAATLSTCKMRVQVALRRVAEKGNSDWPSWHYPPGKGPELFENRDFNQRLQVDAGS